MMEQWFWNYTLEIHQKHCCVKVDFFFFLLKKKRSSLKRKFQRGVSAFEDPFTCKVQSADEPDVDREEARAINTELLETDVSYSKSTRDDFSSLKLLLLKVSCCRHALPPVLAPAAWLPLSSAPRNTKGHRNWLIQHYVSERWDFPF